MSSSAESSRGEFDLAVVGGGSLGCAVAWEAATRGARVALLEQDDFGSGASANSLKIVHGGLRYLQKMDIKRARVSAAERSIFLRVAPHLVQPLACMLPTRRSLMRGRLAMAAGLAVNALVTFDRNRDLMADRRLPAGGLVNLATLAEAAPGLNLEGATAGARWFDAQMADSERLPLAFALGAEAHGALLLNHHRVTEFATRDGRITGVVAEDRLSGGTVELPATVVADCRCAWGHSGASPAVFAEAPPFIKAVNIILPEAGLKCALGFPMRDQDGQVIPGRMLFATPWNGVTVVGTWYSRDAGGPGGGVTSAELAAMLDSVNASYGDWRFQPADVRAVHIGFLPAIPETVTGDGEPVPMDKPMCEPAAAAGGPAGLWYLQTEKWTTVRRLAQHYVDRLAMERELQVARSNTASLPLPGGERTSLLAARSALAESGLAAPAAHRIATAYGGQATEILELAKSRPTGSETIPGTGGVLVAEVIHAIENEHARTLGDLMRRTGIGGAGKPSREALDALAQLGATRLSWDEKELQGHINEILSWPQFRS